jgi:hypothetical protein
LAHAWRRAFVEAPRDPPRSHGSSTERDECGFLLGRRFDRDAKEMPLSSSRSFRFHAAGVLAAAALLAPASQGVAQDLGGALDLGQLGADIGVNRAIRSQLAQSPIVQPRSVPRHAAAPARAMAASLTYTPSLEQRRRNLARFVAAARKRDPQTAGRLERLFASQDVIGQINRQIAPYGFRTNDVADAYAAWWLNAWLASRGRTDDATPRQIAAVRGQAAEALGSLPQMQTASDGVKQELAEAYLVQCAWIGGYLDRAKGNPEQMRRVGDAVREGARAAGLDLASLELTNGGFVVRR